MFELCRRLVDLTSFAICASSLIILLVRLSPTPLLSPSPTRKKKKSKNADRSQKRMKTKIEHVYNGNNGEHCGGPLFFREHLCLKGQNVAHEGQRNWAEDQCRENKLKGDDNQCSRSFLYFPKKALLLLRSRPCHLLIMRPISLSKVSVTGKFKQQNQFWK